MSVVSLIAPISSDETLRQKLHAVGIRPADVRRVSIPLVQSAGYIVILSRGG